MMLVQLINSTDSFKKAVGESLAGDEYTISASDGTRAHINEIQKHNSGIILVNWARADFDAAGACSEIRKLRLKGYFYIIIVAHRSNSDGLAEIIDSGADDFIFMPFGREELSTRIMLAKKSIRTQAALSRSRRKIVSLSKEDPVTSLLNRRSLKDEVLKEMSRASRYNKYIVAMMVSISNYAGIIESLDPETGKVVLEEFGRRLKSSSRPYDQLGRYGISDFLLFLPDSSLKNGKRIAERIINTLSNEKKPFFIRGKKLIFRISIGLSELNPRDIVQNNQIDSYLMNDLVLDSLIKRAETAARKAAKIKGNSVEIYSYE